MGWEGGLLPQPALSGHWAEKLAEEVRADMTTREKTKRVRIGDRVEPDTPLCVLHARTEADADRAEAAIRRAITIGGEPCGRAKNFLGLVTKDMVVRL